MIIKIETSEALADCTSCGEWIAWRHFEEHAFGHEVRREVPYGVNRISCAIYASTDGTSYTLWRVRRLVEDDPCVEMRERIRERFALEQSRQRIWPIARVS